ncbi:hypothetical protein RND81_06G042800 [Saponaria officinalis]|uniref:Uncharacterized protein n=1 Tax=Saponaria officinalis TaxID=3572 RepID=A0AAW1K5R1_SAPOF
MVIMMANLQANHHIINIISKTQFNTNKNLPTTLLHKQRSYKVTKSYSESNSSNSGSNVLVHERPPNTDEVQEVMNDQTAEIESRKQSCDENKSDGAEIECLVREYGWKVRRMVECKSEMNMVALIQAHAFHLPSLFFDDFFFHFFKAEVLAGLYYRLRNSPPDRYACLVAEPAKEDSASTKSEHNNDLVGVVDITVLRDSDVIQHLEGTQEYLYVSGIAVSNNYRFTLYNFPVIHSFIIILIS